MNIKAVAVFLSLFFLAGCQTAQVKEHGYGNKASEITSGEIIGFNYEPGDKEQFVFNTKFKEIQKYGYESFCPNTKTFACLNRLDYNTYVGMKGYFVSEKPAHTDFSGYEFYPVVLENGETYYFVANKKYGGKYGSISPIISLDKHLESNSFIPEPLVSGSEIKVESIELQGNNKYYRLSNGNKISEEKLKLIREVTGKFGDKPELAKLLLDMRINKDEVDYRFFIQPYGSSLRSEALLYIGFTEEDSWLRLKVKYYGDNWLFVNSFTVAADDYRWQSPNFTFKRDHSGGKVWEWVDMPVSEKELKIAHNLADSEKSTIRFRGQKYYSDQHLEQDQKDSIKKIIEVYSLLNDA